MKRRTRCPLVMTLTLSLLVPLATAAAQTAGAAAKTLSSVEGKLLRYDTAGARAQLAPVFVEKDARHLRAMGEIFSQERLYGTAATQFRKATKLAPQDPAAFVLLGRALIRQNRSGDARAAFEQARVLATKRLAGNPKHFHSAYHLGLALQGLKRYPVAIAKLKVAQKLRPGNALAPFELGVTHAYAQHWQDSVDLLTAAIAKNPGIAYAYYFRGMAANKIGRKDLLINDFNRFVTLAPEAPEAAQARRVLDAARR